MSEEVADQRDERRAAALALLGAPLSPRAAARVAHVPGATPLANARARVPLGRRAVARAAHVPAPRRSGSPRPFAVAASAAIGHLATAVALALLALLAAESLLAVVASSPRSRPRRSRPLIGPPVNLFFKPL